MAINQIGGAEFRTRVARGNVEGWRIGWMLGERESVGTTVSGEDIWRGNELTPAPTSHTTIPIPNAAGEQMSFVSESANDTLAGTGVQQVLIKYIDAVGDEQETIVDLNGTTPVDLTPSDVRYVNDMYAVSVGSGGVAAGHLKIHNKADAGLVYDMIHLGGNKSLVPTRMVARGYTVIIGGWHVSEAQGKRVAIRLRSTDFHGVLYPGVFLFKDTVYLKAATSGYINGDLVIPALSIIKVTGWAVQVGAECSCSWWGYVVQDGF